MTARRRARGAVVRVAMAVAALLTAAPVAAQLPLVLPVPTAPVILPIPMPGTGTREGVRVDSARAAGGRADSARVDSTGGAAPADTADRPGANPAATPAVATVAAPAPPSAPGPTRWERTVEVSGSFLYGNTEQTIFSSRGGLSRADSLWGIRVDGRFLIGVASINGTRVMDRRSWLVSTSIDRHPEDTHTQFVLASVERSFELRIDQRVNAGVGYKYVIECDTLYKLDLSVAVLGELNALPQPVAGQPGPAPVVRSELTRLSTRLRYRNQFTDRLNFDHVTWYRPELLAPARFLASSLTAVQYQLTKVAGLRLSFQNEYDSLAQGRGARSNHNGQILIGVNSRF